MAWRYIAQRLLGDGGGAVLDADLPLVDVEITDVLSGPNAFSAQVPHHYRHLIAEDGRPVFDQWGTALWAEESGQIRGGGILVDTRVEGDTLSLECMGFSGYLGGMPYTESWSGTQIDPLDAAREMWRHVQAQPRGNLGLQVDQTTSTPVRIGTEIAIPDYYGETTEYRFQAGPYKLNWWSTDDMGEEFDRLARDTPFDYRERHRWQDRDAGVMEHHLDFAYPRMGRRRTDLRFVLGENLFAVPSVERRASEYASEILLLGAGEGRDMVHVTARRSDARLRRAHVVTDKRLRKVDLARRQANLELASRQGFDDITEISVIQHPNAALGSWMVGDEIFVEAEHGWIGVNLWCRVLSTTIRPDSPEIATLTIARSDKVIT